MLTNLFKFMDCCQENKADKSTEEQFRKDEIVSIKDKNQSKK